MNPYDSADRFRIDNTRALREGGSEFGGVADPQPYPHEPTPSERLRQLYQTDPTDPTAYVDTDQAAPSTVAQNGWS